VVMLTRYFMFVSLAGRNPLLPLMAKRTAPRCARQTTSWPFGLWRVWLSDLRGLYNCWRGQRNMTGEQTMKIMYCWRCRMDVPMLDEEEFSIVEPLYFRAVKSIKEHCRDHNLGGQASLIQEQYRPVLEAFRRITGREHVGRPSDLLHHRIAKYGPPCVECDRPLRTPRATYCAACGAGRSTHS
jgi:hypothetical protein